VARPSSDHEDSSEDEDKYADEIDMPGTKFDSKRYTISAVTMVTNVM